MANSSAAASSGTLLRPNLSDTTPINSRRSSPQQLSFLHSSSSYNNLLPLKFQLKPISNHASGSHAVVNVLKTAVDTADISFSRNRNVDSAVSIPKPTILVSEKLGEAGLELLRSFGNVDCSYDLSPEDLCKKISLCDALIVRSGTKVTRQVFEAAKGRLKVVGRAGVGIDNVDLQAATEFGCLVVNAPTANTIAAAEHGIALLCSMARNVSQADASMKAGILFSYFCFPPFIYPCVLNLNMISLISFFLNAKPLHFNAV